ncbi:MAG: DUF3990 domain-containing protein [Proteobacteria bacterium]|nr:DUF3990 domain-containing protein [Pseudomonadota bacterium]
MILYHGSNVIVDKPRIVVQNRALDFGSGFYTTTNKEQAIAFARRIQKYRQTGEACLNAYEWNEQQSDLECKILRFDGINSQWLRFIADCREKKAHEEDYDYDMIIGPVADDDVKVVIGLYNSQLYDIKEAIEKLKIKHTFNQFVFKTQRSLKFLQFTGGTDV